MKLLFVHQYLGALGGAETDILLTARKLRARGHETSLLYSHITGREESGWREAFPEHFQLPRLGAATALRRVLDRIKPDLVYLHSLADLALLESLAASELPVVRRVHDHRLYCMRGYKYNYFTRKICTRAAGPHCIFPCLASVGRNHEEGFPLKWISYTRKKKEIALNRRFQRFIVYSNYQKEELVRNGFDVTKIRAHVPIRCWGNTGPVSSLSDRNLVLFAGQIIRGKGVDLLLRALSKVRTRFECLILGDGNHRSYCERLSKRLGLSDRVQFCGYIPGEELRTYFLQASVMVISSVWPEPFALVGQEAMRYGLPVVAFDAGGIREWLLEGENGFLAPWMDTRTMAARIEELLRDKGLARRLGLRGLDLVNHNHDAEQQVSALEGVFQDTVREWREAAGEPVSGPEESLCAHIPLPEPLNKEA